MIIHHSYSRNIHHIYILHYLGISIIIYIFLFPNIHHDASMHHILHYNPRESLIYLITIEFIFLLMHHISHHTQMHANNPYFGFSGIYCILLYICFLMNLGNHSESAQAQDNSSTFLTQTSTSGVSVFLTKKAMEKMET